MLAKIAGGFFMLCGLMFLVNPARLKARLQRKALRKVRMYIFFLAVSLGGMLISAAGRYEGILPKVLMGVGLVAIMKGIFFAAARSGDVITQRLLALPDGYFRLFAVGQLAMGALIAFGLKSG